MSDERTTDRPQERDEGRPDQVPPVGGDDAGEDGAVTSAHRETVAPEERGATPSTEHAPGGDL